MFKTVLYNNQDIGMVINKEMSDLLHSNWILEQVIKEYIDNQKQSQIKESYENMWKDEEYLYEMQENTKYLGNL